MFKEKLQLSNNNINNNNNSNSSHSDQVNNYTTCYLINQISNIILLRIIEEIGENDDLICLFLTCKRLFFNIREIYSSILSFKRLKYIDERTLFNTHTRVILSLFSFNFNSFKSLFNNALSNQLFVSTKPSLPSLNYNNNDDGDEVNDNIKITRIAHNEGGLNTSTIKIPPSTTSLYIDQVISKPLPIDYLPSNIRRLFLSAYLYEDRPIEKGVLPSSLTSLKISCSFTCLKGCDALPANITQLDLPFYDRDQPLAIESYGFEKLRSLTHLNLFQEVVLPNLTSSPLTAIRFLPLSLTYLGINLVHLPTPDFFQSLVNLIDLELTLQEFGNHNSLYLDQLVSLKSFNFIQCYATLTQSNFKLPSSLESLHLVQSNIQGNFIYPSNLQKLYILGDIDFSNNLIRPLPQSLKAFSLSDCRFSLPSGFIPSGVDLLLLYPGVILIDDLIPSLSTLSKLKATYDDHVKEINLESMSSIKTLELDIPEEGDNSGILLPNSLEKLILTCSYFYQNGVVSIPTLFPPTLTYLNLRNMVGKYNLAIPSSLCRLDFSMNHSIKINRIPIFSISTIKVINNQTTNDLDNMNGNKKSSKLLLPPNLKKLKCYLNHHDPAIPISFRLDEVINQSNVDHLVINIFRSKWLNVKIKRLSSDNSSVLLVDNKSIFGGIIHQTKVKGIYPPLYLHCKSGNKIPVWSYDLIQK